MQWQPHNNPDQAGMKDVWHQCAAISVSVHFQLLLVGNKYRLICLQIANFNLTVLTDTYSNTELNGASRSCFLQRQLRLITPLNSAALFTSHGQNPSFNNHGNSQISGGSAPHLLSLTPLYIHFLLLYCQAQYDGNSTPVFPGLPNDLLVLHYDPHNYRGYGHLFSRFIDPFAPPPSLQAKGN